MKSEVFLSSNKFRKEIAEDKDLNNIWEDNPSFRDINNTFISVKNLSVFFFAMLFIICTYRLTNNLLYALTIGCFTLILFIISFSNIEYKFKGFTFLSGKPYKKLNLFENFTAFFTSNNPEMLYLINKQELKTIGISIFQISILPETTTASINQFLKSLNEAAIPFTFQIHHSPFLYSYKDGDFKEFEQQEKEGTMRSFKTFIYITVFYDISGIITAKKLHYLSEMLKKNLNNMKTALTADYHHYKAEILMKEQIIYALRLFTLKKVPITLPKKDPNIKPKFNLISFILKSGFCFFITIYTIFLVLAFNIPIWIIAIILSVIIVLILLLWWRTLLYYFTLGAIKKRKDVILVNPFEGINTYSYKNFPESIFFLVDDKLLIKHNILNLNNAALRYYHDKYDVRIPSFYTDKFFHAIIEKQLPFIYTVNATPMSYYLFNKIGYKYLNKNTQWLLKKIITSDKRGAGWLEQRSGIWKTIFTISTYNYRYIDILSEEDFFQLANNSRDNVNSLQDALNMIYHRFETVPLYRNRLISGCLCEIFKTKLFSLTGTYLSYLLIQGHGLKYLTKIEDLLKKGIETRLPVEFNSPLYLENFITFGNTLNTELWKQEIPVGFTRTQINNVLIVNGTMESRDKLSMKLSIELMKRGVPSIIFDFNGDWSRLIKYFSDSSHRTDIVHFRLGTAFGLDILHSDIPYDKDNPNYLEYIYDSFALAFKKDNNAIDYIRNTIKQNPDLDMTSLNLELENQPRWEKTKYTNTLISLFDDLTEKDLVYFNYNSLQNEGLITFMDFISDNKSIIIDLSSINDIKKQIFATFIILSKIIHYIKDVNTYKEKIIFIPHIDFAFNEKYLDKMMDLGKIDKFLDPLRRNGFGLVLQANQIHYLHPHLIKKFKNIVTFQATDYRDSNILRNIIGLQEFGGQGYYSKTRNTTYQIEYVKHMNDQEVVLKREDTNQPFIAQIDVNDIEKTIPMEIANIMEFMKEQGYNLHLAERRILEQTKKTIFEKDFGEHSDYIGQMIIFLDALKQVHNISLHESKIKEEMINIIKKKAIQQKKNNREIRKLRDRLFSILITQRYLVEAHPKDAGGQEIMSTCFMVGDHYDEALQDYYQTAEENALMDVGDIFINNEGDTSLEGIPEGNLQINPEVFKKILVKEIRELYFELFQIYKFIGKREFVLAIKIEQEMIRKFLTNLYQNIYQIDNKITNNELRDFCHVLGKYELIPFTKQQLISYLEYSDELLKTDDEHIEIIVKSTYKKLSDFSNQIQNQLNCSS